MPPLRTLRSPLTIYVVWHPAFIEGEAYARFLYSAFSRDPASPFDRGTGIPVFFRSVPVDSEAPLPIDLAEAERNVLIWLLDDELVVQGNEAWEAYARQQLADCRAAGPLHQFIPVAVSRHGLNFLAAPGSRLNAILLHTITASTAAATGGGLSDLFTLRCAKLRYDLLNELTRLLLPSTATVPVPGQAAPPVKLFLSHARHDGVDLAAEVRQHIRATTSLESFFDVTNIAFGYDFAEAIEASIESSAIIIFQTDYYASRDWCQIEALSAKKHKCPIVVVNALTIGEKRSFPYLGNVPTVRWYPGAAAAVVAAALQQVLHNLYTGEMLRKMAALYGHPERYVLASPPELLDFVSIRQAMQEEKHEDCVVIYPDPPLSSHETLLLSDNDARLLFITPTQLPILKAFDRA